MRRPQHELWYRLWTAVMDADGRYYDWELISGANTTHTMQLHFCPTRRERLAAVIQEINERFPREPARPDGSPYFDVSAAWSKLLRDEILGSGF